jgi:sec-independent protein translocase protein TatA
VYLCVYLSEPLRLKVKFQTIFSIIKDTFEETPMFGLGLPELGIIAVVAILIFGPKKIPELGASLGKTLRGFKEELQNPSDDNSPEEKKE